ncbi:hypothetical protein [Ornithinimicrobium panacihumi]|uniref:hypothetical protein n=1 Tax=Ornithinimicrobium panacihumi TaxID=2008449 RepID=UPI003F89295A
MPSDGLDLTSTSSWKTVVWLRGKLLGPILTVSGVSFTVEMEACGASLCASLRARSAFATAFLC